MSAMNTNELAAAANRGEAYQHLTQAQTWNAYAHGFTPDQLPNPLPPSTILVFRLAEKEQKGVVVDAMFSFVEKIKIALDDSQPPYIRLPALDELRESLMNYVSGESMHEWENEQYQLLSLEDIALVLGSTEDELLALAEQTGTAEQLRDAIGVSHSTEFPN